MNTKTFYDKFLFFNDGTELKYEKMMHNSERELKRGKAMLFCFIIQIF